MRHLQIGRKLGVSAPHRKALLRSLTLSLIEHEAIKTTPARAKELRWYADRVVTLVKRGDVASLRQIVQLLGSTETYRPGENRIRLAIERLKKEIVPRFQSRTGGYTQILRLARNRAGDNAEMCVMRYIPSEEKKDKGKKDGAKKAASSKKKAEAAPAGKKSVKAKTQDKDHDHKGHAHHDHDHGHSHGPEDKPVRKKTKQPRRRIRKRPK